MPVTYHLTSKGVFAPCEATQRACPLGEANHLVFNKDIKDLDDLWDAFKTAKEGKGTSKKTTTLIVDNLNGEILEEITAAILTDPDLTEEEKKAQAEQLLKDSQYSELVLHEMVVSKLFTYEEVENFFDQAPDDAKYEFIPIIFGDTAKYEMTDETLSKYAPYVNQSLNTVDKKGNFRKNDPYFYRAVLEAVATHAKDDKTIVAYLPTITTLDIYMKRYSEPRIAAFLKNPHISKNTATTVFATILRTGLKEDFLDSAVALKRRTSNIEPGSVGVGQVAAEIASMSHDFLYDGQPEPQIVTEAKKVLAEANKDRASSYIFATNDNIMRIYDSYKTNHEALQNNLTALKKTKRRKTSTLDSIEQVMLKTGLEGRLRSAKSYRQEVNYYYTLFAEVMNSQKW